MSEEKSFWNIDQEKSADHWLELNDPEGWRSAEAKWDGCVHYYRYFNTPKGMDEKNDESRGYFHICDVDEEIERLQALKKVAVEYFAEHGGQGSKEYWKEGESNTTPERESIESIHNIAFAAINQIEYWKKYGAIGSTDSLKTAFDGIINLCEKHRKGEEKP